MKLLAARVMRQAAARVSKPWVAPVLQAVFAGWRALPGVPKMLKEPVWAC